MSVVRMIIILATISLAPSAFGQSSFSCYTLDSLIRIELNSSLEHATAVEISRREGTDETFALIASLQREAGNLLRVDDSVELVIDHPRTVFNRSAKIEGIQLIRTHALELSLHPSAEHSISSGEEFAGQLRFILENGHRPGVALKCFRWLND